MMINLEDKVIAHLLAHKGVQLSHLESQQIEILSHELSCAHCKLLSGFRLVEIWAWLFRLRIQSNSLIGGTQREYSSKPLKHSIVERILVFKR